VLLNLLGTSVNRSSRGAPACEKHLRVVRMRELLQLVILLANKRQEGGGK
jgi:hypothetical protein